MLYFFNIELLYMCILIKLNFKCVVCNIILYMNGDSEVLVYKKL